MDDRELNELRAELAVAQAQIERLRQFNDELQKSIRDKDDTIRQAKDINPVGRVSLKRVLFLARAAFLDISKIAKVDGGGWFLNMGLVGCEPSCQRKFKSLRQIWDILCLESWSLSDLFGDFLVTKSKAPKLRVAKQSVPTSVVNWRDGYKLTLYDSTPPNMSAAQNAFETWNSVLDDYVPFSSSA